MAVSDLYKVIKKEETYEYVAKLINKEVEQILSSNLYTMAEQLHLGKSRVDILDYIENLLEKDTPKKVLKRETNGQEIKVGNGTFKLPTMWYCPSCKNWISPSTSVKYCGHCGHSLDWG